MHLTGLCLFVIVVLIGAQRPDHSQRKFVSVAIDEVINQIKSTMKNADTAQLFENAFPNTLDTTVQYHNAEQVDTFIITGDINAMWLRDSTNQVLTYRAFYTQDAPLKLMVKGVIRRQISQVLLDPYANAFNFLKEGSDFDSDYTTRNFFGLRVRAMVAQLHERKFETDSITNVLRLQNVFVDETGDTSIINFSYFKALKKILGVFRSMQQDQGEEHAQGRTAYTFSRTTNEPTDTVSHQLGYPCKHTGMIRSFFRPSDDSTLFQFNIPGNAFVSATLRDTFGLLKEVSSNSSYLIRLLCDSLGDQAAQLGEEVRQAIYKYGLSATGDYFMYEVDGFGNGYFMDDANQPSLLGMPLFNFVTNDDTLYLNTRQRILSASNPYYFSGKAGSGVGGPHVGIGYIWPMSLITQAMTSNDKEEVRECLNTLSQTTASTYFIHESFNVDNADDYTRSWFAWANGLFGELIIKINTEFPDLLRE